MTLTRSFFTTWVGTPRGFLWTRNCGIARIFLPPGLNPPDLVFLVWYSFFSFLVVYSWIYIPGLYANFCNPLTASALLRGLALDSFSFGIFSFGIFSFRIFSFRIFRFIFLNLHSWFYGIPGSRFCNPLAASALLRGLALGSFSFGIFSFGIFSFIFLNLHSWFYIPGLYSDFCNPLAASALLRGLALDSFSFGNFSLRVLA